MKKLLTIVVPVYKVEKYINKCLDSLILPDDQMKKLEVIVVNDGTPDNSAIMAKEYEKRFPETFQVIDKENGGHGSAWNKGVELATGKYLRFLDSDDWLTNLSEFIEKLEKYNVDLVFTDLQIVNERSERLNRLYQSNSAMDAYKVYNVDEYDWKKTDMVFNGHNITNFHMCTYRTDLLKPHHPIFFEKMFYDDEILFILPLCFAKSFVYLDFALYNYLFGREGQTMDPSVTLRNIDFKVKIRKYEVEFYNKNHSCAISVIRKQQYILNSRNVDTLLWMALLPYSEYKRQTRELSAWLKLKYPEFSGGKVYNLYKFSPLCFWLLYHYIRPIWAFIKIDIFNMG